MQNNLENKILKKIKTGEVKMKPKWKFEAEKKTIIGAWLFSIGIAAITLAWVLEFFEVYEPLDTLTYGEVGRQLLLEDFPYIWLTGGLAFILLGLILDSRIDGNYKKPTRSLLMVTLVIVLILVILYRFLAG
jgi:hypothetical protein